MHEKAAVGLEGYAGQEARIVARQKDGKPPAVGIDVAIAAHRNRLHSLFGAVGLVRDEAFQRIRSDGRIDDVRGDAISAPLARCRPRQTPDRLLGGIIGCGAFVAYLTPIRSEEHTSELQSLMRISYAVFC